MSIQRFRGISLREALAKAETALGPSHLVLCHSRELKSWLGASYYECLAARRENDGQGDPAFVMSHDSEVRRQTAPWMSPFEWREEAAWVFCGLSGAGKTSAMVKLAAALKQNGVSPRLVSRDYRKLNGSAELAQFSRQLRLEFTCEPQLGSELGDDRATHFIDTPGMETVSQEEVLRICREVPGSRTILVLDATQKMTTLLKSIETLNTSSKNHRWDAFMLTRWDLGEDWELVEQVHRLTQCPLLGISTSPRFDVPLLTRDLSFAIPPSDLSRDLSI